MGQCRRYCHANEELKAPCKNRQVCCVPLKKGRKSVSPVKEVPRTFSTQASYLSASPMDYIITIPSSYSDLEVDLSETENEQSDQVLDTELSPPPVPQISWVPLSCHPPVLRVTDSGVQSTEHTAATHSVLHQCVILDNKQLCKEVQKLPVLPRINSSVLFSKCAIISMANFHPVLVSLICWCPIHRPLTT